MRGLRSARVRGVDGGSVRAAFKVTKLRLPANLVVTPGGAVVTFGLDAAAPNVAVERLAGAWRVEPRDGGGCRVALTASVEACRAVPRAPPRPGRRADATRRRARARAGRARETDRRDPDRAPRRRSVGRGAADGAGRPGAPGPRVAPAGAAVDYVARKAMRRATEWLL